VLSEHHGIDDGWMPAPVTMAASILAATQHSPILLSAAILPLHDPIRIAEQIAVIDNAFPGRLWTVLGAGYREEEFEMAGIDRKQRGKLLEEYVGVMRQAWSGEYFEWRGRRVRVMPKPKSPPPILVGGSTELAARRAARLRAGFQPAIRDEKLAEIYKEECRTVGFEHGFVALPGGPGFVHVSADPERDWARIGPHALYDARTYDSWQTKGQRSQVHVSAKTIDDVRRSGVYAVVTPEECVELAKQYGRVILHPLMGGMAPELGWEGLRLFEREVLPRIK